MASVQKIKLSPSRDIPFNKLVLSQSNVRRVKAGISIEQLAESIAQRTLLQSLSVRAVVDASSGMAALPRTIPSPRMTSGSDCIRSISSARSSCCMTVA